MKLKHNLTREKIELSLKNSYLNNLNKLILGTTDPNELERLEWQKAEVEKGNLNYGFSKKFKKEKVKSPNKENFYSCQKIFKSFRDADHLKDILLCWNKPFTKESFKEHSNMGYSDEEINKLFAWLENCNFIKAGTMQGHLPRFLDQVTFVVNREKRKYTKTSSINLKKYNKKILTLIEAGNMIGCNLNEFINLGLEFNEPIILSIPTKKALKALDVKKELKAGKSPKEIYIALGVSYRMINYVASVLKKPLQVEKQIGILEHIFCDMAEQENISKIRAHAATNITKSGDDKEDERKRQKAEERANRIPFVGDLSTAEPHDWIIEDLLNNCAGHKIKIAKKSKYIWKYWIEKYYKILLEEKGVVDVDDIIRIYNLEIVDKCPKDVSHLSESYLRAVVRKLQRADQSVPTDGRHNPNRRNRERLGDVSIFTGAEKTIKEIII